MLSSDRGGTVTPFLVAGADGCRSGWVVVRKDLHSGATVLMVVRTFPEVIDDANASILAVDIPIGLPESAHRGGRTCDILARKILGQPRTSSIFSPPARFALGASSYPEALRMNRESSRAGIGISRQFYVLSPKLREVDETMTPELQARVREVHPELCFLEMNGGKPLPYSKKSSEGFQRRMDLIRESGFPEIGDWVRRYPKDQVSPDDVLDAFAACWTAERFHWGVAEQIPADPEKDSRGLRMEMWA